MSQSTSCTSTSVCVCVCAYTLPWRHLQRCTWATCDWWHSTSEEKHIVEEKVQLRVKFPNAWGNWRFWIINVSKEDCDKWKTKKVFFHISQRSCWELDCYVAHQATWGRWGQLLQIVMLLMLHRHRQMRNSKGHFKEYVQPRGKQLKDEHNRV